MQRMEEKMGLKSQQNGENYEIELRDRFNAQDNSYRKVADIILGPSARQVDMVSATRIPTRLSLTYLDEYDVYDCNPEPNIWRETAEGHKADIHMLFSYLNCNRRVNQIECSSLKNGFGNHIDRRDTDKFAKVFHFDPTELHYLNLFTGLENPSRNIHELNRPYSKLRDCRDGHKARRIYWDEIKDTSILKSIEIKMIKYQRDFIELAFRGYGELKANWFIVKKPSGEYFFPMDSVIDYAMEIPSGFNNNGGFHVGRVNLQRKGSEREGLAACQIQSKMNFSKKMLQRGIKIK